MGRNALLRTAHEVACKLLCKPRFGARFFAGSAPERASLLTNHSTPAEKCLKRAFVGTPWSSAGPVEAPTTSPSLNKIPRHFSGEAKANDPPSHHSLTGATFPQSVSNHVASPRWLQPAPNQTLFNPALIPNTFHSMHSPRPFSTGKSPSDNQLDADKEDEDGEFWEDDIGDASSLYETILAEVVDEGRVGLVTINRPDVLNALSTQVMDELTDALQEFDADPRVKAIILTGSGEKAFAAGADIKEMRDQDLVSAYLGRLLSGYEKATSACRTPIIAAVNGYALGGGCELAMMCDVILAGENAVFGQPETNLGVIPGMGGTQRLIRAVGKSRAMEMILSGAHFINAEEAVARGLASRVISGGPEALLEAAIDLAKQIARLSAPVVAIAKEAVNSANDLGLSEGVKKEGLFFSACFGLQDQKEGMTAFLEKRKARFEDR